MATGRRVLVVDDDAGIREMIGMALTDEGYEVRGAANGALALAALAGWPPDVILLDLRMAVMDGAVFSRAYRATPGPHAPLVLLTAIGDPDTAAPALGVADILAKPFSLDDLLAVVGRHAGRANDA